MKLKLYGRFTTADGEFTVLISGGGGGAIMMV
jgi:hypothetical protein